MCGIAGIVRWDGRPVLESEVRAMCAAMVHRGPDDEGIYVGDGVALGMRRLSIIDLDSGHQPVSNEDGSVWVVFNGEIYNYRELRRALQGRGHTLGTASDTETIVHLYEDYGPRCVDHLRGMFALAIWDGPRRQLLLARDRLGIKPLYYAERDGELLFASELKPILQIDRAGRSLSWEAVGHLFTFLATPPAQSIVAGISKLEPARVAIARAGRPLDIMRYWDVAFEPDETATEAGLVERLRDLLTETVTLHQVSDVPVGAFLSGGIDSSAIVALMAAPAAGRLKTFSIGFAEAGFDELAHARAVAAQFGTDHYDLVVRPDVVRIVEDLTWYLDEPFGDTSAIPTYMVSKLAAEHVTVVLSGDGGDELFAGYDKYVVEGKERAYDRLPGPVKTLAGAIGSMMPHGMRGRRFLRHLALDGPSRYLDASTLFHADEMPSLFQRDALEQVARHDPLASGLSELGHAAHDWLSAVQYRDLHHYLPLDILTKVDRMTMAHSLEARPPLLDHRLVEFAATIPARLRLRGGTTKYLFKQAMRGILPDGIIDRRKHGFAVPLAHWFRGELAGFAHDLLLSDTCRRRGIFNLSYIERLLRLNARGRNLDLQLWTALSFEMWCRRFLDSRRPDDYSFFPSAVPRLLNPGPLAP
ncbi:MAG: asparagine synthase (glutamine-hydrolyzing) [Acidobacteria bacterium RIFCSPLOWO2_02_FULL_68_18]|nr:MAG: asparagine synthase (glutamine-hydrolyzing) [Acidobacteria bacterium RIFCSPLOWO2_02_FULL_68_18]OFW48989.1 MAG: asparagine synthase (glutamine-hydrolyzing) [Acidobacteria bacterium RIFCSPLOWO2_12_FULL_68_19]